MSAENRITNRKCQIKFVIHKNKNFLQLLYIFDCFPSRSSFVSHTRLSFRESVIDEFFVYGSKTSKSRKLINWKREYRWKGDDNEQQGGWTQCPPYSLYRYFFIFITLPGSRPCYATFVTVYRGPCHGINRRNISGFECELSARTYEPPDCVVCTQHTGVILLGR